MFSVSVLCSQKVFLVQYKCSMFTLSVACSLYLIIVSIRAPCYCIIFDTNTLSCFHCSLLVLDVNYKGSTSWRYSHSSRTHSRHLYVGSFWLNLLQQKSNRWCDLDFLPLNLKSLKAPLTVFWPGFTNVISVNIVTNNFLKKKEQVTGT